MTNLKNLFRDIADFEPAKASIAKPALATAPVAALPERPKAAALTSHTFVELQQPAPVSPRAVTLPFEDTAAVRLDAPSAQFTPPQVAGAAFAALMADVEEQSRRQRAHAVSASEEVNIAPDHLPALPVEAVASNVPIAGTAAPSLGKGKSKGGKLAKAATAAKSKRHPRPVLARTSTIATCASIVAAAALFSFFDFSNHASARLTTINGPGERPTGLWSLGQGLADTTSSDVRLQGPLHRWGTATSNLGQILSPPTPAAGETPVKVERLAPPEAKQTRTAPVSPQRPAPLNENQPAKPVGSKIVRLDPQADTLSPGQRTASDAAGAAHAAITGELAAADLAGPRRTAAKQRQIATAAPTARPDNAFSAGTVTVTAAPVLVKRPIERSLAAAPTPETGANTATPSVVAAQPFALGAAPASHPLPAAPTVIPITPVAAPQREPGYIYVLGIRIRHAQPDWAPTVLAGRN